MHIARWMRRATYVWLASVILVPPLSAQEATSDTLEDTPLESAMIEGLSARAIGPAVMSGRVAALDAVPEDPLTIYVGAASGGVWKSEDGGVTYEPVFDEHTQSIGAIEIDPVDPGRVWVGSGESWTRNSVSVGTGVYLSTDAGDTWEFKGLGDSERIARIVVDPTNGDRVFVCATGHLWDANEERGVYRTTDGGETWERVLYVDANTGCSDISMDPEEPEILYAGMWQFRRWPWFFESGGPGSGLYRSKDGGDTWQELTRGLPDGEKGRIAVDVAPSRPSTVYALVEAEKTAVYRSDDLGEHWEETNASFNIQVRPFYFAYLVVDPTDHRRVYKPGLSLSISTDGGESFTSPFTGGFGGSVHSDHHALWINPNNPHELILGTDGGVYISQDRGTSFRHVRNLPISQFYEIGYDMEWPYNVYGGLQDNGTWMGPSRSVGGVENRDWTNIGYGDGFHAFVDPNDPDFVYVEYQGGNILRYRKSTRELKEIRPYAGAGEPELRFNWNTPIHVSPTEQGTIYLGAQYLFRSRDRGESWERISPDLTTDDPEKQRQEESGGLTIDNSTAENHTTIYTISESPQNPDVVWVGTDDGLLHVTPDGGNSWRNVVENVPGLPENTWVSHVEASPHDEAAALVTFDGHRTGDMATYVYRTEDMGSSWESLVTDELEGYAHVVKQDRENADLLFLGTEFGLFISVDGGASWARHTGGIPTRAPVHDLAIHPRDQDLIVATHGRGVYILDDITPLRHLTADVLASDATLLPSAPAIQVLSANVQDFPGDGEYQGRNPPEAANIVYYQRRRHIFGDLKVEVYDTAGALISTVAGTKRRGLNRVQWPMRLPPPKVPPATSLVPAFSGPRVAEGTYTVKLVKGNDTYEGQVALVTDPRSTHSEEDRRLQTETSMRLYRLLERLTYVVDAVNDLQEQARARADTVGGDLGRRLTSYADQLEEFRAGLVATSEAGWVSGDEKLREQLGNLYGAVSGYDGRPTSSQLQRVDVLAGQLQQAERRFDDLTSDDLASLNSRLERSRAEPLRLLDRAEWEER